MEKDGIQDTGSDLLILKRQEEAESTKQTASTSTDEVTRVLLDPILNDMSLLTIFIKVQNTIC